MKGKFLNDFRLFLSKPGKNVFFTCLFYAFWPVILLVTEADYELHSFEGRPIGIATLEAFDVGARVSLFYRCILVFFAGLFLLHLLAYFINKKTSQFFYSPELRMQNYLSLAGIFLCVLKLFDTELGETLEIIYFLQKLLFVGLILRLVFIKSFELSIYHYAILICISVSAYFIVIDINDLAGYSKNPDFYLVVGGIFCLLAIILNLFLKRHGGDKIKTLAKLAQVLLPLMVLPLISVLKGEVFLICKANKLALNQVFVYVVLFLIMALWIYFRARRFNWQNTPAVYQILAKRYFPWLVVSLTTYTFYAHFAQYYDEVFESGNVYLPIMEYQLFGTISPFEKFNPHLLSDYFFGLIYTFFNGIRVSEVDLYDFLLNPISGLLYYYLLFYITRNPFVALFSVILFPYAEAFLPLGFCVGIIGVLALQRVISQPPALRNYILFFLTILIMIAWRIDIGYTAVLAMPILLFYYHYQDSNYKINWFILFKAIAILAVSSILIMAILSGLRGINYFTKLPYALHYFMSAQSYGYNTIGWTNLPGYKMHYFVFPAAVAVTLLVLALRFKSYNLTKGQRLTVLSLIYCGVFYFVNFNRGLIRHSLIEWTDVFTSSFVYIIMAGLVYVFLKPYNQSVKFVAFCAIAFVMISNYRVPDTKGLKSTSEIMQLKLKRSTVPDLSKVTSRVNAPANAGAIYKEFVDFIKANTAPDETFIDFSNKAMFYFYTQKETPSYFYQNPICSHNDFLQKQFISDLKDYKVPYLLFSTMGEYGFDIIDQVPNALRHYRMAEYFYNHYQPYVTLGRYVVWKQTGVKDQNKKDTLFSYHSGKNIPEPNASVRIKLKRDKKKKYVAKIITTNRNTDPLKVYYNNRRVYPNELYVNDTTAYYIMEPGGMYAEIELNTGNKAIKECVVLDCKYVPDYYSQRHLAFDYKKLPYVWGKFDKELANEINLFEKQETVSLAANTPYLISIPADLDKKTGNTIILTLQNKSRDNQKLSLSIGNSQEHGTTNISMTVLPSDKEEQYAIRISNVYRWYQNNINQLSLLTDKEQQLVIKKIKITRGN